MSESLLGARGNRKLPSPNGRSNLASTRRRPDIATTTSVAHEDNTSRQRPTRVARLSGRSDGWGFLLYVQHHRAWPGSKTRHWLGQRAVRRPRASHGLRFGRCHGGADGGSVLRAPRAPTINFDFKARGLNDMLREHT
ncbi:MAG: hypothetical protein ACI9W2_004131 [Gammaproteobacteria bacterium]|jgi:hypothetical protein